MKTVFVLTLGWLPFDSKLNVKNIMGMILAIIGMVVYSWAVELQKKTNARISLSKTSLTEEEICLLRERELKIHLQRMGSLGIIRPRNKMRLLL